MRKKIMNTPVLAFAFVCLVIVVLIVFVRPRMKPRGKLILPKTMGMSANIEHLKKDHSGYHVSYSGTKAKPSALLFVPRQGSIQWVLPVKGHKGWKPVEDDETFVDIIRRLDDVDMGVRNQLKVVLPPGNINGKMGSMCLIYTSGSTSPYREGSAEDIFVLPPVPERTDRKYDRNT
jgi:hypothetical protein